MNYTTILIDEKGKFIFGHTGLYETPLPVMNLLGLFSRHVTDINFPLSIKCELIIRKNIEERLQTVQNIGNKVSMPYQNFSERITSALCENVAKEVTNKSDNHGQAPTHCLQELSVNFKKLLDEAIGTDVTIHVEDSSIKAHKVILRARSPVFEKMFDHDTSEAIQNEIDIKDISASTMKELLTFLYTGTKQEHAFDDARDLYYAADKYEVLSLRNACKEDLIRQLQVDNACQVLILANNHGDELLKKEVTEYIKSHFQTIVATKSFEELANYDANLSVQLMRNYMLSK